MGLCGLLLLSFRLEGLGFRVQGVGFRVEGGGGGGWGASVMVSWPRTRPLKRVPCSV